MAKVAGLIGSASGKVGNIVYVVTNGIQVARVYQPVVSNPKSNLQLIQRTKGNLAGRVSSFIPRTAIIGLGENNRMRRGAFLRNMLKSAQVTQIGNDYTAKIADEDVMFSVGTTPLLMYSVQRSASQHTLSITLSGNAVIDAKVYDACATRIVALIYDEGRQELIECVTAMAVKPEQGGTAVTTIPISTAQGFVAAVYLIPMSTNDGTKVTINTESSYLDDNDISAMLSINSSKVVFSYGRSLFIGTATYTTA